METEMMLGTIDQFLLQLPFFQTFFELFEH